MSHPALIDIGANLTHESFANDLSTVLSDAHAVGVERLVITGASVEGAKAALTLATNHSGTLFATAGVHPHHAKDWQSADAGELRELLSAPEVVAAGECGLDYFRNFSSPQQQADVFERQLALAVEAEKPVFLHQRDAHDAFLEILDAYLPRLTRAVAHCFTGNGLELDHYIERGLYVGITGWICDERRGHHLIDLVPRIPDERLMIETDAPYLMPRTIRPKPKTRRNEPKYLPEVLRAVSAAAGREPQELARQTTRNAERFFELPARPPG
ncbi:MAG: TatD family hydrolase [Gammaproteobacteria bacterium]